MLFCQRLRALLMLTGCWALISLGGCSSEGRQTEAAPPTGHYEGTLTANGTPLRVVLDVRQDTTQALQAELYFPEWLLLGFPAEQLRYEHPQLRFVHRQPEGRAMQFNLRHEGNFLQGAFKTDSLQAEVLLIRRDQAPPSPYREVALRWQTAAGPANGTLLVPNDTVLQHPAVVLLHGSTTPQQHELSTYASWLARHGIATLVFDRRDARAPKNQPQQFGLQELAADAAAALRTLKLNPEIDSARVGLWGISQGATVAALVAGQPSRPAAFVVGVSAPGMSLADVVQYQNEEALARQGATKGEQAQAKRTFEALERYVRRPTSKTETTKATELLSNALQQPWVRFTTLPQQLPDTAAIRTNFYWRELNYDPRDAWQAVRVPVLLQYGTHDERLDARVSAERLRLAAGRRGSSLVRVYAGANHELTLPAATVADGEAGQQWQWPRPVPGYLEEQLEWLQERTSN
ncbi:alpha/beta hydrolase family protein [Solirubrum puertoriconensis]|uniref:AB hydrolase-1 domain-containing protein n=1 Tax=Solirubrum puertoriconensis TaxID=1751427 RepID=A0A9X0L3E2_SOLP1|nr:alpha/beta fold hydrolase [Solirubrum puertoriconensis]KUG06428.1 hypothetical protein ASU33_03470 [Solirubrum puertoriconensis]